MWYQNKTRVARNLTSELPAYSTPFVTRNGDIYFENGNETGRIDKWAANTANSVFVAKFTENCYGLFVDLNDTLYCSAFNRSQVLSVSLITNVSNVVAGNGSAGTTSAQLSRQRGIFVDTNFDLYVADTLNHRVQLFRQGQRNGTTVAGNGVPNNLTLVFPADVVLDGDGYLFVADTRQHRIVRVGRGNYSCVAGCTGANGSRPDQLNRPHSVRFDSLGNLYVADEFNNRIQKFTLQTNSCGKSSAELYDEE